MSEPSGPGPEIIPPDAADPARWQDQRRRDKGARIWVWTSDQRGTRLRYGRPGPFAWFIAVATLAALGALGFFVFLGALTILIPFMAALVLIGLIAGIVRRL